MTLWLVLALLTSVVMLWILRPLGRQEKVAAPARAAYDRAIFRDQLDEIERDRARGVLNDREAAAARLEVERRLLAAVPKQPEGAETWRPAPRLTLALILVVPGIAISIYALLGNPDLPDQPLASRALERSLLQDNGDLDLEKIRTALQQRLARDPSSVQGWILLAKDDESLRDWNSALAAWTRARALAHDRPDLLEGIGETLVAAAGGRVTPDAVALFEQAARADSSRFGARYYLALAKAQGGDIPTAMTLWRAMQADVPANSPWREQLAATLQAAQQQAGGAPPDVAAAGSPSDTGTSAGAAQQAAILGMAPEQRMEAISGMVDGLAERLANQPNDLNGWKRLGRAYMVLGKADKSAAAYAHAATLTPNDPELLAAEADAIRAASIKDKNIDPADAAVPDAAQALYVKALALDPNQPQGLWFVGLAASHAHRLDEARQDWTRLLGLLDPNSTDYLDVKRALDALAKS